ncbi:MAG: glycosyltransferase family 2 protein [Bacteroidales bacterium]|nr:glycosyltransferase family 2 protein [Bacteroidales bacterium]
MHNTSKDILVSVVVPCRNEAKYIEICINSIISNKLSDQIEVLIADGESNDGSKEIITELAKTNSNIRLINNPQRLTPFGLNIGIENARGKYIMIASSHSAFQQDYIPTLLKELQELDADGIGGIMETKILNSNKTSEAIRIVLTHPFGVGNSYFRIGIKQPLKVDTVPFGLYKKSFFDDVGLYNTKLIRNHDIELSKRALALGKKIFLTPSTSCTYYARETFSKLAKNNFKNGFWNFKTIYITKKLSSISLRHFVPFLFIMSLIIPIILGLIWSKFFILLSCLSLLLYTIFILFTALKIDKNKTSFFKIICAFAVLHFSYGSGSVIGMFSFINLFKK